ncbi:hypothetical protein C2S51_026630 [Perilla frutescens var. frutescens]|nr:hypothetical protein C2S51_026630 [Perilla frutescens var. frutescens]
MEAAHLDRLEDDVFFKDLSKQISLLIMDDDDEDSLSLSLSHPSVNLQAFTQAINPAAQAASFFSYDHQQTSKRESKGTGVFIPRSTSNPRRNKNVKQARFMASGNNKQLFQRPCDDHNSRGLPHNNMINPSCDYHSFNFRRF